MRGQPGESCAFDSADLFTCDDEPEDLTFESPEEAIEAFVNMWAEPDEHIGSCAGPAPYDLPDLARRVGPVTVFAYRRRQVEDSWYQSVASRVVELIEEQWGEDYGDPDGDFEACPEAAEAKARAWLRDLLRDAVSWRCECVAERTYSVEEIEELLGRLAS